MNSLHREGKTKNKVSKKLYLQLLFVIEYKRFIVTNKNNVFISNVSSIFRVSVKVSFVFCNSVSIFYDVGSFDFFLNCNILIVIQDFYIHCLISIEIILRICMYEFKSVLGNFMF